MKKTLMIGLAAAGWWLSASATANQQDSWLSGERQYIAAAASQLHLNAQAYQQQLGD